MAINEGHPVYISYSWNRLTNQHLEDNIDDLCKLMKEKDIEYLRDKEGLSPYHANINKVEEEIGKGDAIIVALSANYLKSPHCLHELHEILKNGDYEKRLFPILLKGFPNLSNDTIYNVWKEALNKKLAELVKKSTTESISDAEQAFIDNQGYLYDLEVLKVFLQDYVYYSKDNSEVINSLKDYFSKKKTLN